jgi:hypothetical protein
MHRATNARRLADLARCCAVSIHGVSLGLASCEPSIAGASIASRASSNARPESWSEHLAFVRAGGVEIGHLAAPPRTAATVEGTLANLELARRVVGDALRREHRDARRSAREHDGGGEWVRRIVSESRAPMLLDLHNLYANAVNFGTTPEALLLAMPLDRVGPGAPRRRSLGSRILRRATPARRPPARRSGSGVRAPRNARKPCPAAAHRHPRARWTLPRFDSMLAELARAREALERGRARRLKAAA